MAQAWHGTIAELREYERSGELVQTLSDGYEANFGTVTDSERNSWVHSVPALLGVLGGSQLDDVQVLVEFQMPVGADRADVVLLGGSEAKPKAFIIELKQWTQIEAVPETLEVHIPQIGIQRHPSIQVLNYRGKLRFFNSRAHRYSFDCAVFCHNMSGNDKTKLSELFPKEWTEDAPIFGRSDSVELEDRISRYLLPVTLPHTECEVLGEAQYEQSQHLFRFLQEHAGDIASDAEFALANTGMGLTDEQARIKAEVIAALDSVSSQDFIVQGGPGSGKTLLAVSLMLQAFERGHSCILAMRNNRLFAVLKRILDTAYPGVSGVMMYFETSYGKGIAQSDVNIDLIVCDEAQRMREMNPLDILPKARVTAIFLDETQRLNPPEKGTVANIRQASLALKRTPHERRLAASIRCLGGLPYHQWVELLLSHPLSTIQTQEPWNRQYALAVFATVEELLRTLEQQADRGARVAMVASFTESPGNINNPGALDNLRLGYPLTSGFDLYRDSAISVPWLMSPAEYVSYWRGGASNSLRKVASIYGAQGFESDYIGVIWGRDLLYRDGRWSLGNAHHCYDWIDGLITKRSRQWHADALSLILNRYRIFLTRGIKGTFIFCEDAETRHALMHLNK